MSKNRFLSAFTAATMVLSFAAQPMSLVSFAEDIGVAIDEQNFPDDNFRSIVAAVDIDTDGDGILSAEEAAADIKR